MESVGDGWTTIVVVADTGAEYAIGRLGRDTRLDVSVVDAVARLHLAARRLHLSLQLRNTSHELRALLDFVGLADVIRDVRATALGLEERRQAERGEQLGTQEVVVPGDPPV